MSSLQLNHWAIFLVRPKFNVHAGDFADSRNILNANLQKLDFVGERFKEIWGLFLYIPHEII